MYVLYYDESKDFIGTYDTKAKAFVVARVLSRERKRSVLGIFNRPLGGTQFCFKFELGEQTYDGGCCPSPWDPRVVVSGAEAVTEPSGGTTP